MPYEWTNGVRPIAPMVMPIVGMKMIGSVAPALTAGAAGVVVEILLLTCSLISDDFCVCWPRPEEASKVAAGNVPFHFHAKDSKDCGPRLCARVI